MRSEVDIWHLLGHPLHSRRGRRPCRFANVPHKLSDHWENWGNTFPRIVYKAQGLLRIWVYTEKVSRKQKIWNGSFRAMLSTTLADFIRLCWIQTEDGVGWGGVWVGNLTCSKGRAIKESWTPSHFPSWNCFSPARVTFFHSQWPSEKRTAREKQFLGQGAESQSGKNLSASLFTSLLCFICFLPIYEFHNLILHMDCYCPI